MKRAIITFLLTISILFPLSLFESCEAGLGDDMLSDGKKMFWSDFDGVNIDVYIDNSFEGTIDQFFNSTPDCGSDGCVTITRSPGTYHFHAEEQNGPGSNNRSWDRDITINAGTCGAIALTTSSSSRIYINSERLVNNQYFEPEIQ